MRSNTGCGPRTRQVQLLRVRVAALEARVNAQDEALVRLLHRVKRLEGDTSIEEGDGVPPQSK